MTRKYTLSVPEEFAKKIDTWRDRINLSELFREAVSKMIDKKESFQQRMEGDETLDAIVDRLRAEKMAMEQDFSDIGSEDGIAWAKAANYQTLLHAVRLAEDKSSILFPPMDVSDVFQDELLGNYFQERIDEDALMAPQSYAGALEGPALSWLMGWRESVLEFWNLIKDRLL